MWVIPVLSILGLILILIIINVRIVPQASSYVIERLGTYNTTWNSGLHFKIPLFDKIVRRVSLKEQVIDFEPQPIISKDNVTTQIDTVVYFQIVNSKLFVYGVNYPMSAIENLTATTLRNVIGNLELDEILTSRDLVNTKMREILDQATKFWGIKINRVELKNILPPKEIQDAMEKQMKAERERRQSILRAEGEKKSSILIAEGNKEATILGAEAAKQSAILRAEAQKEVQIREAEGKAEAVFIVQQAMAEGIKMLNAADPSKAVIAIKSLEALEKMADGKATKIIIPSEIQGFAGLAMSISELIDKKYIEGYRS
jgi:regulator of protease activity HflC (stomatin/prohibitin superfamily)